MTTFTTFYQLNNPVDCTVLRTWSEFVEDSEATIIINVRKQLISVVAPLELQELASSWLDKGKELNLLDLWKP